MDPSSLTMPSGPMSQACARVIESEVTSLLFNIPMHEHEICLLPQTGTLCILRYEGYTQDEPRREAQVTAEDEKEVATDYQPDVRLGTGHSG